ncbi:serine/threonine-protein kinase [Blastococcus sp. URHD0036]|uniref:serine/threonine-protein kinase n=1 Tax=Blastococcus sp. URHD0036 TaxID=1380356 RepID=UPI001E33C945|nr:serine/threonine-protein kinase [Blastococcus sp. URHD0036]
MQPGVTTIADRYELRTLLATGGMGQVWRGHDTLLGRDVAVKVLRSEYTGDPSFLARFRAEARHTAVLGHPNIATLYDYGEVPAGPGSTEHLAYLVMELVDGEALSQLLARGGPLDAARTADVLRQTAAGLGAAHAVGVVHRDVKPGNVLVRRDGTSKLTDFGIASSAASVPLTGTGQIIGTAYYLSPEQAQGAAATPASDVYALGLVGYEMLAGRRAFDGENSVQVALRHITDVPPPLPATVPAGLRDLIDRALVKDPARRIPDGNAFRDAVDDVLAGRAPGTVAPAATRVFPAHGPGPSPATARAPRPQPHRRSRRRGLVAALAALAVLAVLAVVLVLSLAGDDDPGSGAAAPTTSAPTTSSPAATAAPEPEVVEIDAADYVGRPVGEVQAELTRLGLTVQLRPVTTADAPDGEVLAVSPDGELAIGRAVTLTHAAAPPPTSAPAPSSAPAPAPSEDDGGSSDDGGNSGNGNGNGNGNGGNNGNGNRNGNDDVRIVPGANGNGRGNGRG